MRRPVGIILAAIVLGLIALFGTLLEGTALAVSIFSHSPVIPKVPLVRAIMIGSNAMALCFFLFCIWTVVGLLRMRGWSRIAILVIGGLVLAFSSVAGAGTLFARRYADLIPQAHSAGIVQTVLVGIAVFYFLVATIGLWWLIYFNLKSVRGAFVSARATLGGLETAGDWTGPAVVQAPGTPGWRIVIMVWAWLMLASLLYLPVLLWMRLPMFFFGAVLRGWVGTLFILALWAVEIYVAVGLLRKWKPAWYLAMLLQLYGIGYCAAFLIPSVRHSFLAYQAQVLDRFTQGIVSPISSDLMGSSGFLGLIMGAGTILILVLIWALIRRREDYLAA